MDQSSSWEANSYSASK